ncbi:GDF9 factor, partial [Dasyornis broadbenti]|nr:GDF9 factor [Dasyornis broadbenti]
MESLWTICVCLYCSLAWLCAGTQCSPRSRGRGGSGKVPGFRAAAEDARSELRAVLPLPEARGAVPALLPPLLKVLSDGGPRAEAPRLQPDSRALRYMKRLYRMSATREGIPRAHRGRLYNTVRLFTPCWECEHRPRGLAKGDVHSVDLLFNLDRVTAWE